jgi:hypothetical protein
MIGVLLLCHLGVQNPNIWTDWASCDKMHPIQLFALCEKRSDDTVCQKHGIQILNIHKSKWCEKGIAHNTFYAFKHIVEHFPDIEIVYLASGFCLPVQQPSYLYRKPFILPKGHVDHPQLWNPRETSMAILLESPSGEVGGIQWMSLSRTAIQSLRANESLLKQTQVGNKVFCPDETYLQTLVYHKHSFQNVAITDQSKSSNDSPSPIEWHKSAQKRTIVWDQTSKRRFNTPQVLNFAREAGYVFSRKYHCLPGINSFADLVQYMYT